MDQLSREQYIEQLSSASWQDIKDEAEKFGVEKGADEKWKDLIPAITAAKFKEADLVIEEEVSELLPVEALSQEDKDFLEPELVEEETSPVLSFDYVRGIRGVLTCPVCDREIHTDFDLIPICAVANPVCPRPKGY